VNGIRVGQTLAAGGTGSVQPVTAVLPGSAPPGGL
jgi:hypothetical protein